jgi:hypothetical protein
MEEPILRLSSLQLQRQRCGRLECFFTGEENISFLNALGYSWRCEFLQRWRCNSRSLDWLQDLMKIIVVTPSRSHIPHECDTDLHSYLYV